MALRAQLSYAAPPAAVASRQCRLTIRASRGRLCVALATQASGAAAGAAANRGGWAATLPPLPATLSGDAGCDPALRCLQGARFTGCRATAPRPTTHAGRRRLRCWRAWRPHRRPCCPQVRKDWLLCTQCGQDGGIGAYRLRLLGPNSCCARCMPTVLPAPPSPPRAPAHPHAGPAFAEEAALVEPVAAVATVQAPVADVMTAAPAPAAEPVAVVAAAPPAAEEQPAPAALAPAAPAQEVAAVVAVAEAAPVAVVAAAPPSLDEAELLMAAERQSRAMDIVSAALSQADQLLAAEQLAAPIDISTAAAEAESQPARAASVAAAVGPDEAAVQADIVEIEAEEKELEVALAAIVADEPPAVAAALVAELQVRRRRSGRALGEWGPSAWQQLGSCGGAKSFCMYQRSTARVACQLV